MEHGSTDWAFERAKEFLKKTTSQKRFFRNAVSDIKTSHSAIPEFITRFQGEFRTVVLNSPGKVILVPLDGSDCVDVSEYFRF